METHTHIFDPIQVRVESSCFAYMLWQPQKIPYDDLDVHLTSLTLFSFLCEWDRLSNCLDFFQSINCSNTVMFLFWSSCSFFFNKTKDISAHRALIFVFNPPSKNLLFSLAFLTPSSLWIPHTHLLCLIISQTCQTLSCWLHSPLIKSPAGLHWGSIPHVLTLQWWQSEFEYSLIVHFFSQYGSESWWITDSWSIPNTYHCIYL